MTSVERLNQRIESALKESRRWNDIAATLINERHDLDTLSVGSITEPVARREKPQGEPASPSATGHELSIHAQDRLSVSNNHQEAVALSSNEQVSVPITDHAEATTEQLVERWKYCMQMISKIRHRQTRREWFEHAGACDDELERRGIDTFGIAR